MRLQPGQTAQGTPTIIKLGVRQLGPHDHHHAAAIGGQVVLLGGPACSDEYMWLSAQQPAAGLPALQLRGQQGSAMMRRYNVWN